MKNHLRTSFAALALAMTVSFSAPETAQAYSIALTPYNNVVRWGSSSLTYYLDPNGAPGITNGSDVSAMKASFTDWQNVSCSALTFQFLGNTSNKSVLPISGKTNGKNELVFINNSAWDFGKYVLGVTSPLYYYDGVIFEADIAFNGYLQTWTTGYDPWKIDVKSVVIHEIGHFFGLQHVLMGYDAYDPPTMAPQVGPSSTSASLENDDKAGACFLYPASGYYSCSNNDDCPYVVDNYSNGEEYYSKKINCESGYCTGIAGVAPGSVEIGGTCSKTSDCGGGNTCETMDSGLKMCTATCDPYSDNCPSGFHCQKVYTTGKNLCIAGTKKKKVGEACTTSYECETSFCFPTPDGSGMTCRIACTTGGSPCPSGQECWTSSFSTTGGCFPSDQVPTIKKPLGSDCVGDYECKSDICFGDPGTQSLCRQSCNLNDPSCYAGYYCANIGGGRSACLPGEPQPSLKDDGAACGDNTECLSNWCVQLIGTTQGYCRRACNLVDWLCPWGTACVSYGSDQFGVCMPDIDKNGTGDACTAGSQCITGICWTDSQNKSYCTQNCINSWCPNNMQCVTVEYFGSLCALPADVPPQEVLPQPSDTGWTPGPDAWVPQTDAGNPNSGDVPINPPGNGGSTCSAGNSPASGMPVLILAVLMGIAWMLRRREA